MVYSVSFIIYFKMNDDYTFCNVTHKTSAEKKILKEIKNNIFILYIFIELTSQKLSKPNKNKNITSFF